MPTPMSRSQKEAWRRPWRTAPDLPRCNPSAAVRVEADGLFPVDSSGWCLCRWNGGLRWAVRKLARTVGYRAGHFSQCAAGRSMCVSSDPAPQRVYDILHGPSATPPAHVDCAWSMRSISFLPGSIMLTVVPILCSRSFSFAPAVSDLFLTVTITGRRQQPCRRRPVGRT